MRGHAGLSFASIISKEPTRKHNDGYTSKHQGTRNKEQEIRDKTEILISTIKESYQNGTAIHEIEKNVFFSYLLQD